MNGITKNLSFQMLLTIKFAEKEQELIKVIFSNSSTSRASNILNKQIELSTSLITSALSEMPKSQ